MYAAINGTYARQKEDVVAADVRALALLVGGVAVDEFARRGARHQQHAEPQVHFVTRHLAVRRWIDVVSQESTSLTPSNARTRQIH